MLTPKLTKPHAGAQRVYTFTTGTLFEQSKGAIDERWRSRHYLQEVKRRPVANVVLRLVEQDAEPLDRLLIHGSDLGRDRPQ